MGISWSWLFEKKNISNLIFFSFVVLSVSVAPVRALAQRKTWRAESRMSGLQSRLIWRLWHSQRQLQYLASLPTQLMVWFDRAFNYFPSLVKILQTSFEIAIFNLSSDTFMVEDAVEAIGFGTFQWKLSILTGLSWVRKLFNQIKEHYTDHDVYMLIGCVSLCILFAQMADAMEMMILSILAPQLHCEWRLPSLEVALLTSVMAL